MVDGEKGRSKEEVRTHSRIGSGKDLTTFLEEETRGF